MRFYLTSTGKIPQLYVYILKDPIYNDFDYGNNSMLYVRVVVALMFPDIETVFKSLRVVFALSVAIDMVRTNLNAI